MLNNWRDGVRYVYAVLTANANLTSMGMYATLTVSVVFVSIIAQG